MPALPWTSFAAAEPDREYVVMASRLPLTRHRTVPTFLRATVTIRRQLTSAEGLIGYSLDAKPIAKTFWTLSAWRDEQSLAAFAHADPHADRVAAIRPHMGTGTFVTWTVRGRDLPITWADARARVEAAR